MLKKRLIGVVLIKDGWAVQSFGYSRFLPLGKPECLVENLDRWGADEIMVLSIDRSRNGLGPDFNLLKKLSKLGLSTPLIYGGGIDSVKNGVDVIRSGADRVSIDSLLFKDINQVSTLAEQLGAQAVIASLPLVIFNGVLSWINYEKKDKTTFSEELITFMKDGIISEALVIDYEKEGSPKSFNDKIIKEFPVKEIPLIAFGGLSDSEQISKILRNPQISAIAIGNFLSYKEHCLQFYKENIVDNTLRASTYKQKYSLLNYD